MTALNIQPSKITMDHLAAYYKLMLDNGDNKNAEKVAELYRKQQAEETVISFAGHFSAGKSSMINTILNKDILPKSPIPTSANVVKITSGEGAARVFFYYGDTIEYQEPYDIEMIKEYGKDKDAIKSMELSTSDSLIPDKGAIVDTPGIDAADDADRLMTESSLHLVDMLFYIMDYNHVQSEVNLYFLKSMQDLGIPFYIIINQIDKHDEAELSFAEFEKKVNNTFDQWDIKACAVYFSSLIDETHPYNQFPQIKEKVFQLLHSEKKSVLRIDRSAQILTEAHKQFLNRDYDEKTAHLENRFTAADSDKLQDIEAEIASLESLPQDTAEILQSDLQTTLNNAYLMPANLRDTAALFLASRQKDFKVGLFGSKRKTKEEKTKRLNDFLQALLKNIEASMVWKIRDKLISRLKENNITDSEIMNEVQQLNIVYTKENVSDLIKPGAKVNADAVLNYTNDVSEDIKRKVKDRTRALIDMIVNFLQEKSSEQTNVLVKQRDQLESALTQQQCLTEHQEELREKLIDLDNQRLHPEADEQVRKLIQADTSTNHPVKQVKYMQNPATKPDKTIHGEKHHDDVSMQTKKYSLAQVTQGVEQAIQAIASLPGLQPYVKELKDKKRRLTNRNLTIALFGAFSAGKSSFANALLGESLLPSSPNPTTAVISRITPVTDQYVHGTVIIQLKDEATLVSDLQALTSRFSPETVDFPSLLEWVKHNKLQESNELNKLYQSYLQAMIDGYAAHKDYIGKQMTVTLEEFVEFVTDEAKACYMENVDLYYDCALTRQGITLVDTPGADSVNARHTNVAFDYIKYADAILYVTYYNHALSRADKDFLLQLGRVKEAFELDKMFFVINAADLAENTDDLQLVKKYVEEQLLQSGIRFPKIFPVSSKHSLKNKQYKEVLNEKMAAFEADFYQFIHHDLAQLTMESAAMDIRRIYQVLTNQLDMINLNEQERQQYQEILLKKQENITEMIENTREDAYEKRIEQKIKKQLHYVKERLAIRFHDIFKEIFNPTAITASGKKAQEQLRQALVQLLDYIGYELLQELRAVSLRVEAYIAELKNEVYQELNQKVRQIDDSFIFPALHRVELETPSFEQAFSDLNMQSFAKTLARFKSTKSFFAGNEKETMKEEIYSLLDPSIDNYIDTNRDRMEISFKRQWEEMLETMKQQIIQTIKDDVKNNLSVMEDTTDISLLRNSRHELTRILEMADEKEVEF